VLLGYPSAFASFSGENKSSCRSSFAHPIKVGGFIRAPSCRLMTSAPSFLPLRLSSTCFSFPFHPSRFSRSCCLLGFRSFPPFVRIDSTAVLLPVSNPRPFVFEPSGCFTADTLYSVASPPDFTMDRGSYVHVTFPTRRNYFFRAKLSPLRSVD